jgi:glycosyltransferase involved in cell wall biosynthesis
VIIYQDLETYIQEALFILFQFCFIVQIYYLVVNQNFLAAYVPQKELPVVRLPISVIISARNEAKNLRENLPAILQQDYPYYEVIVVNDCSYDSSEVVLTELQEIYRHLRIVTITEHDRFKTGKKFALTLGIKAAKNEYLLFTDADCKPASVNWITRMAANFAIPAQIIIGYSPYKRTRNILNPFIRFETIKTAINYLSAALNNNAYMGVGRNLAYTKTLFFDTKGFAAHMHVLSGDDDLFVNKNATPYNTVIEMHPETFTHTDAKTSISGWFRQKKRHFGVGKFYKKRHKRMLSLDAISGFLFYILFALCLIFNFEPWLAFGLFIFRLMIQLVVYNKLFKRLDGKYLLWYLPFFDMLYYIYLNTFALLGTFLKTTQWK